MSSSFTNITNIPFGFSGQIYRSAKPFNLPSWHEKLTNLHIDTIVLLLTPEETYINPTLDLKKWYEEHHFNVIYFPIKDFSTPENESLDKMLDQVSQLASDNKNIVIHCKAGIGRTGLVCSCLAKKVFDCTGIEAINWVRKFIPDAVETYMQEKFVRQFGHECCEEGQVAEYCKDDSSDWSDSEYTDQSQDDEYVGKEGEAVVDDIASLKL